VEVGSVNPSLAMGLHRADAFHHFYKELALCRGYLGCVCRFERCAVYSPNPRLLLICGTWGGGKCGIRSRERARLAGALLGPGLLVGACHLGLADAWTWGAALHFGWLVGRYEGGGRRVAAFSNSATACGSEEGASRRFLFSARCSIGL
jgi:hypothetical protein